MSLELKKALYHLSSLSDLSQEINSEDNFLTKIRSVLYVLMGTFLANKGAIFWHDRNKGKLVLVAHKGFDEHSFPRLKIRLDQMRGQYNDVVGAEARKKAFVGGPGPDCDRSRVRDPAERGRDTHAGFSKTAQQRLPLRHLNAQSACQKP